MSANRKYIQLNLFDLEVMEHYLASCIPYFPGETRKQKLVSALNEAIKRVHQLGGEDKTRICLANAVRRREW